MTDRVGRTVTHTATTTTATYCSTLQHTATHCNTLRHTATHCITLHHTATHCNTLQHTATHRNSLQLTASHRNTLPLAAIHSPTSRLVHTYCSHYLWCRILQHGSAYDLIAEQLLQIAILDVPHSDLCMCAYAHRAKESVCMCEK